MILTGNNRKMTTARLFAENADLFKCPVCSHPLEVVEWKSLICSHHHCFDIARKGYVNFLSHPVKTKYDKTLFEARKRMSDRGFFDPLMARISERMIGERKPASPLIKVLDAGCGEGSHLSNIQQRITERSQGNVLGIGIDISKEGIHIAARHPSHTIWCVADLAQCPLTDKQFNFILNILSPSNYAEFQRILADDGMVIKVVPERKYLQELRGIFYVDPDRSGYSNENTVELFKRNFALVDIQRVQYGVVVEHQDIERLVRMTPLSWGASEERIQHVLDKHTLEVTFDFSVLFGKKMD